MRRLAGTRKVGHAGTLDPMATGLLILGLGPSTRLLTFIVGLSKEYLATIRLGSSSTTDDAEGDLLGFAPQSQLDRVTNELIAEGIIPLTGEIEQVPSTFSAIKVDGKRAYALAREGESVELKQANHVRVGAAKRALETALKQEYDGSVFLRNFGWFVAGLVAYALLLIFATVAGKPGAA